jgi:NAD(P)-dependent dehydrogenase (short-subunit alcohol dehydrogenase family)
MNKTFLIVGGSKGIGRELAINLHEKGNRVIVFSRSRGDIPDEIEHHVVDFSEDKPNLPELDAQLNGLVYMPGSILIKPFRSFSSEDFSKDYRINVLGAIETIRKYMQKFEREKSSSIVLMSTVAVSIGMPYHSLVATSKGAIEGLTRSLAAEFAPNVRVNAIAPSLTDTTLAEKFIHSEEKLKSSKERHPLKKIGNPAHIAEFMEYLLSDSAEFITSQVFRLDGGMSGISKI